MNKNKPAIETLEDLAAYAIQNPHDDTRYQVGVRNSQTWDDPEAGAAWEQSKPAYVGRGLPGWPEYKIADDLHQEQKPSQHETKEFYLRSKSHSYSWRSNEIQLSQELGELVYNMWNRKPGYEGQREEWWSLSGYLTLPGILRKLGKTEVNKLVKATIKTEKLKNEMASRNYYRRQIQEAAEKLIQAINIANNKDIAVPQGLTLEQYRSLPLEVWEDQE